MKPHGKRFSTALLSIWTISVALCKWQKCKFFITAVSLVLIFSSVLIKAGGLYCCRKVCGAAPPAWLRSSLMIMPHGTAEIEMERHHTGRREGKLLSKEREREKKTKKNNNMWRFAIQIPTLIFRVIPSLFWQLASRFSLHPFNLGVNKSGSKSNQSWLLRLGITAALYILTLALIPSQLNLAVRGERTGAWH